MKQITQTSKGGFIAIAVLDEMLMKGSHLGAELCEMISRNVPSKGPTGKSQWTLQLPSLGTTVQQEALSCKKDTYRNFIHFHCNTEIPVLFFPL